MTLVIQAYGRDDIVRQAQYCVLSCLRLMAQSSPMKIVLYTDKIQQLRRFFGDDGRVDYVEMTPEMIKKFRGAIDFVHRVKVEVLMDAAKRFPGPLYYVDGDTIFQDDPSSVFANVSDGVSLLHVAENSLEQGKDPLSKKLFRFFRKNTFTVSGKPLSIPTSTIMYNAGAIGLSRANVDFLPEVLELTDVLYTAYPKHIMEQLAFSYILQTRTRIVTAEREILHYWNEKDRYQKAIDEFLARFNTAEEAIRMWSDFKLPRATAPKRRGFLRSLFGR